MFAQQSLYKPLEVVGHMNNLQQPMVVPNMMPQMAVPKPDLTPVDVAAVNQPVRPNLEFHSQSEPQTTVDASSLANGSPLQLKMPSPALMGMEMSAADESELMALGLFDDVLGDSPSVPGMLY